jgi:hypothetical protein
MRTSARFRLCDYYRARRANARRDFRHSEHLGEAVFDTNQRIKDLAAAQNGDTGAADRIIEWVAAWARIKLRALPDQDQEELVRLFVEHMVEDNYARLAAVLLELGELG